ncbi:MAG: hypothetical protein JNN30_07430 [Rhodanobacteraceae bacterium]|nr:hypothetical protein [Rhodanobacteraceae bacterium]
MNQAFGMGGLDAQASRQVLVQAFLSAASKLGGQLLFSLGAVGFLTPSSIRR